MRGNLDFSSWSGLASTLFGLILISLIAVGIRLIFMQTIQRRRERENRQINERLRTLIAAYKTLGGSFTGELAVDPSHLGQLRQVEISMDEAENANGLTPAGSEGGPAVTSSERRRRIRDTVEASLSDVILLGTDEQVRLAAHAATEMVAGRKVELAELVVSLRNFIRQALDLAPIPLSLIIPSQGPLRPSTSGGRGGGGDKGGGMDGGMGAGIGAGVGANLGHESTEPPGTPPDEAHR
ncbi:MAG: hypothetical protein WBQ05_12210 [Candidatus Competibacter denitrificans]